MEKLPGAANFRNKLSALQSMCCCTVKKELAIFPSPSRDVTTGCRPPPPPLLLREGRQVEIIRDEEITPLLPTGKGERFSQTISKLGHVARLRR